MSFRTLRRRAARAVHSPVGIVAAALLCATPLSTSPLHAQGGLSSLGFGYPVGGTSTRAAATGGAFGEFDALSPINPSALGGLTRTVISVQAEPEFRTLTLGGVSEKTRAQRIPLLSVAFPFSRGFAAGVSASTFLDRSYSTVTQDAIVVDGQTVNTTDQIDVRGSIGDLRMAVGWRINDRFSVGVGGHLFTGDNLVARERTFEDTLRFGSVLDSSRVVYFGRALSLGGEWRIRKGLATQVSFRRGGTIDARVLDTVRTRASVPDRLGIGLRYDGIPGSVFAAGIEQQDWTSMQSLGSDLVKPRDATNWHVGAETAGPRLRGVPLLVRAGYARNALPFGLNSGVVNESRLSAGLGVPIAREQASLDLSVQRAKRTLVGGGAKEKAWLLGIGVQIRP